jgi:hypothetical protein
VEEKERTVRLDPEPIDDVQQNARQKQRITQVTKGMERNFFVHQ